MRADSRLVRAQIASARFHKKIDYFCLRESGVFSGGRSSVFSAEMDAASILDGYITRIFEKRLRTHDPRSILVQVGEFLSVIYQQ